MSKVTIYRFSLYDINTDESRQSRRWATLEAIKRLHGEVHEETATEVDASVLEPSNIIHGLTARDFNPHPRTGFQTGA